MEQEVRWALAKFIESHGKLVIYGKRTIQFTLILKSNEREYLDFIYGFVKGSGHVNGFAPYELKITGYKAMQFIDYLLPYMSERQKEFKKIRDEFVEELLNEKIKKEKDFQKMLERNNG